MKALYATGLFQDVRPTIQGGRLVITVIENPVINRIAFEGNKKVRDEQLRSEIQSKERGTLSRPVVQADKLHGSWKWTGAAGDSISVSSPRLLRSRTIASISFSRSAKVARPASKASSSSVTAIIPGYPAQGCDQDL